MVGVNWLSEFTRKPVKKISRWWVWNIFRWYSETLVLTVLVICKSRAWKMWMIWWTSQMTLSVVVSHLKFIRRHLVSACNIQVRGKYEAILNLSKDLGSQISVFSEAKWGGCEEKLESLVTNKMYKLAGSSLQRGENSSRQWAGIESDNSQEQAIIFHWNRKCLSQITPIFIKYNQSKTTLIYKISFVSLNLAWSFI